MFFITCMAYDGNEEKDGKPYYGAMRTFGYKENLEDAKLALHENWCDMHECLYSYAVIENIPYGKTYKKNNDRIWFKYDKDKDGFFEIEQPNHHKIEENFSLR